MHGEKRYALFSCTGILRRLSGRETEATLVKTKYYNGLRIPSNEDPFKPGFVRRLQAHAAAHGATQTSHRPVAQSKDQRFPYETLESAALRFGTTQAYMHALFEQGTVRWELNCEKWRYEIVGDVPEKLRVYKQLRARRQEGYTSSSALVWIGDFIIGKHFGNGFFVSVLWVLLFVSFMWPFTLMGLALEYMIRGDASMVGMSGSNEYLGGGGIFDEVSSRRREDLQWMLGIGKYAGRGY